jgi:RES domain-containing protein
MLAYRLVPKKWTAGSFSGEGARRFGGRWNPKGTLAIYASEHLSLAVLEIRVNQAEIHPDEQYVYYSVTFHESLVEVVEKPPFDWLITFKEDGSLTGSQIFGARWLREERSAVLSVPSSVIHSERNLILNPAHPDFAKIRISDPIDIDLDQRLWRTRRK